LEEGLPKDFKPILSDIPDYMDKAEKSNDEWEKK